MNHAHSKPRHAMPSNERDRHAMQLAVDEADRRMRHGVYKIERITSDLGGQRAIDVIFYDRRKCDRVALVDYDNHRVLVRQDLADSHLELLEAIAHITDFAATMILVEDLDAMICPSCHGAGRIWSRHEMKLIDLDLPRLDDCSTCDGEGTL